MATTKEDYCSKEIYRLLIEKGFDGEIHTTFDEEGYTQASITLQMAMKWLREVHNIFISIDIHSKNFKGNIKYCADIYDHGSRMILDTPIIDTYEEAVEAAIKYCLTNLI